ncbi:MAG TPA: diguanylate cyclase [Bryobacteraceae bacterium]|nr:diguanylate cyclase [Bryobacteraceae bacterium]
MRQLGTRWHGGNPVSFLIFEWEEVNPTTVEGAHHAVAKQLADRLTDLVRTRDIVARWGTKEFAVIFACSGVTATPRASSIAEWLTREYSHDVDGTVRTIRTCVTRL